MAYWICIYPITCLFYMIKNRKRLNNNEISAKMGFYINGYRDQYYFW